jgi:hypothetical protein
MRSCMANCLSVSTACNLLILSASDTSIMSTCSPNHYTGSSRHVVPGTNDSPMSCTPSGSNRPSMPPLSIYKNGDELAYLLLYVDNIVLTTSSTSLLQRITTHLDAAFALKDLGSLTSSSASKCSARSPSSFFIKPSTPMTYLIMLEWSIASWHRSDTSPKSSSTDDSLALDGSFYRSIAGALQYLTLTQPDITYIVNQACLHMHAPRDTHWALIKRILRYIRGTIGHGIHIYGSTGAQITVYSDVD